MVRSNTCDKDVTSASEIPHGVIGLNHERSHEALNANPCIVTPLATRTPIAAIFAHGASLRGTHTPDLPSTRAAATPHLSHRSISACSSFRTYATTSTGSSRRKIG